MTAWAQSLIRISNYEVETLQKRLAEITARRASAEMRIAVLEAEHPAMLLMDVQLGDVGGIELGDLRADEAAFT